MLRKPIVGIIGFSDGDPEVHEELKDVVQKQVDVIEEELRKSGYTDVGQNRWESDKMIAAITEVKVL